MPSTINPTLPVQGVPASKADLRANLLAAKNEIDARHPHLLLPVTEFGAIPAGANQNVAINSAAISAACTEATGTPKIVYIPRDTAFDPTAVVWKTNLTVGIGWNVRPTTTWTIDRISLIGLGGENTVQLAAGAFGRVVRPTSLAATEATVHVISVQAFLSNLVVLGNNGTAIRQSNSYFCHYDNVAAQSTSGGVDCIGMHLINGAWVTFNNCTFSAGSAANGLGYASIFLDGQTVFASKIFLTRCSIATTPIVMKSESQFGSVLLEKILVEGPFSLSQFTELLRIEPNTRIDRLVLDLFSGSDVGDLLKYYINNLGTLEHLVVRGQESYPGAGRIVSGNRPQVLTWESGAIPSVGFLEPGQYPRKAYLHVDGEAEQADAFRGNGSIVTTRQSVVGVFNDSSLWGPFTSATATPGQPDPTGLTDATLVTNTSTTVTGIAFPAHFKFIPQLVNGDWVIVGLWIANRSTPVDILSKPLPALAVRLNINSTGDLLDGRSGALDWPDLDGQKHPDSGWRITTFAHKVTKVSAQFQLSIQLRLPPLSSHAIYRPFILLAAAGTWAARDIVRDAATATFLADDIAMGHAGLLPKVTFKTGRGPTASRPSATVVGAGAQWFDTTIGKPIWSNGSTWVTFT